MVEASRETRSRLSKLEQKAGASSGKIAGLKEAETAVATAHEVVEQFGSPLEKSEIAILRRELERSIAKGDERGLRHTTDALESLRWRVLFKQDWFWQEIFDLMRQPGHQFLNKAEAEQWLSHGEQAIRQGDGEGLREAVRQLWKLQTKSQIEQDRESALRSGLRRY